MKKLIAIALLIAFVSCRKNADDKAASNQKLTGTWELRMLFSGWAGPQTYPSGNNNRITFNNATVGDYTATGLLTGSGTFKLSTWTSPWGTPGNLLQLNGLQYGNSTHNRQYEARIANDTLQLDNNSTIADGVTLFYVKQP